MEENASWYDTIRHAVYEMKQYDITDVISYRYDMIWYDISYTTWCNMMWYKYDVISHNMIHIYLTYDISDMIWQDMI